MDSENLDALITGLRSNSLLKYTHILTGMCIVYNTSIIWCGIGEVNVWSEWGERQTFGARKVSEALMIQVKKMLIFAAGYCGKKSFLEKILDVVTELKRVSPNCLFCMYEPTICNY